jgi:hypothetical protein
MAKIKPERKEKKIPVEQPALFYFLRRLERAEDQYLAHSFADKIKNHHEVPFDLVELFIRRIRQQNIFVRITGPNGKPESLLLNKVLFSMSKVVRIFCSLSMRDEENVYLRMYPDTRRGVIAVERLVGQWTQPQRIFAHHDQCHAIRFLTNWIVERLDWKKTKLRNLDIYKLFVQTRQEQLQQQLKSLNEQAQMHRMMGGRQNMPASDAVGTG